MIKSSSMDAERENRENTHDELMHSTIDTVCQRDEQSYAEFVNSFIFLQNTLNAEEMSPQPVTNKPASYNTVSQQEANVHAILPSGERRENQYITEEDQLEEETLEGGTVIPSLITRQTPIQGKPLVKMDNFIDDEEDLSFSEDDNDDVNDYLASMGFPQKGQNSTETQKCVVINDITDGASSSAIETNGIDNANDRLLYPGEIQELPSGEGCEVRARELDISTTRGTAAGEPTIHVTNDVEPFALDEDFDYDNVSLTPKFTSAQVAELQQFANMAIEQ